MVSVCLPCYTLAQVLHDVFIRQLTCIVCIHWAPTKTKLTALNDMAYYIRSLQTLNQYSNNHYDTFMVAEHALNDPREEEHKTKFISDIMPIEFDSLEAERRINEESVNTLDEAQKQSKLEMTTGVDVSNTKILFELAAINAKFDTIKLVQDINDERSKKKVDGNITKVLEMLSIITEGINQMDSKISTIEAAVKSTVPGIVAINRTNTKEKMKSIMEFKAVQNLEKLTSESSDWVNWQLRLKNALTQVDGIYEYIVESIETITRPISSFEDWKQFIAPRISVGCGKTELEVDKLKRELYTVLTDKCTSSQVSAFKNDEKDGIYAYYSIYCKFRIAVETELAEKRELLTKPLTAKNESEVYDCIITWEREIKEQEKLISVASRPIISKTIKGAVIKNIAVGSILEHIKTHEATKDFDVLREEVLQMAMANRTEQIPRKLNALMNKLKEQMEQTLTSVKESEFNHSVGKEDCHISKVVAEINAMMKAKGKGMNKTNCNGINDATRITAKEFRNHQTPSCDYCGVDTYTLACTRCRMRFCEQCNRAGLQCQCHLDRKPDKLKTTSIEQSVIGKQQSDNVIMNVKGTWEKITFTGDSGAVDHVITPETGKAFEVQPTAASKAGFGFRAANGTPIKIFGERKLNGVTDGGDAFKMNCQVTDVKKNLASFVKMVNEGNDIVMSKKGSFIKNVSNGKVIKLNLDKGTPQFDVWVKKAKQLGQYGVLNVEGEADIDDSAFRRLEMCI